MYTVEFHITGMKGMFEHQFRTKKATAEFIEAIKKCAEANDKLYHYNVRKNGKYIIFK